MVSLKTVTIWVEQRCRQLLIAIIILAVFSSLAYSFLHRIRPAVDAAAYQRIALHIVAGEGFRETTNSPLTNDPAMLRAGPGYEYFLALLYRLFGVHIEVVWVIQAILHGLSTLLVYLIARRLFRNNGGHMIGLFAAVIYGMSLDLIEISAMLLTETVYLFLMILTVYFFQCVIEHTKESLRLAGILGFTLGAAVLFRPPVALFFPIVLFCYIQRRWMKGAMLSVLCFSAILAPWSLRNAKLFHQFLPTTFIGSYNLWLNNLPESTGGQFNASEEDPGVQLIQAQGGSSFALHAHQEFVHNLIAHPLSFVRLCALRIIRYFSLLRPMGFWFYQHGISKALFVAVSGLGIVLLFSFGYSGMWLARRSEHPGIPYLIVLSLCAPLALIPTVVESRYRFQIYPFLAIWAGYALFELLYESQTARAVLWKVVGCLIGISLLDAFFFAEVIRSHLKVLGF